MEIRHFVKNITEISKRDAKTAGGKGASLGELIRAKIPVPPGYVLTASAFDEFMRSARLDQEIEKRLAAANFSDLREIEKISRTIRNLIEDASLPRFMEQEISAAFGQLSVKWVAVRSSATLEDSVSVSWAGELESYLNTTRKELIPNIKKCWASLYAPRALIYRREKGLKDVRVSVAVVIQAMVQSEVSGITFTVHPVTKDKNQMIIEACYGLGEYVASGKITPDSYVVSKKDMAIIDVNVSGQVEMLALWKGQNLPRPVPEYTRSRQKLDGARIRELAEICLKVEDHYGFPSDIEWGLERGKFYILQARPITTL
ncbi:MAG: PEP/pyruvate-binding domain-containing protein [bacterium]